jgi:hypothetical protein
MCEERRRTLQRMLSKHASEYFPLSSLTQNLRQFRDISFDHTSDLPASPKPAEYEAGCHRD